MPDDLKVVVVCANRCTTRGAKRVPNRCELAVTCSLGKETPLYDETIVTT